MRAVVQRVLQASVEIEGAVVGSCGQGFLVLLGVGENDTEAEIERLWSKIFKMRIFPDGEHHTGAALSDVNGEVLVVSQFTLYADCKKGNRPSFVKAGSPDHANALYEYIIEKCRERVPVVEKGSFGAEMEVELVNDGPFTVILDSDTL